MIGEIQEESGAKATRPLTLEEELAVLIVDGERWDRGSIIGKLTDILKRRAKQDSTKAETSVWRRFIPRVLSVWAVVHPTEKKVIAVDDQGQASVFTVEEFKTVFKAAEE